MPNPTIPCGSCGGFGDHGFDDAGEPYICYGCGGSGREPMPPVNASLEADASPADREAVAPVLTNMRSAGVYGLSAAAAFLAKALPGWFIYRGGNHVAIHRDAGSKSRRIAIVTEG
jgi:hypothetical protein